MNRYAGLSATLVAVLVGTFAARICYAQSFEGLGSLPAASGHSDARAVNQNGGVIVGFSGRDGSDSRAFRWSTALGMEDLGTFPNGGHSFASGVSADGSVVVGTAAITSLGINFTRGFRWTSAGGIQDVGVLPGGITATARGVNADGTVVVGEGDTFPGNYRGFRTSVGNLPEDLGALNGSDSSALAVNATGEVVVGGTIAGTRAFRWTATTGMQDIGSLPGMGQAIAFGVSAEGETVVGRSGSRPFRWTAQIGMQDLGLLEGWTSAEARGVSGDGSIVVGEGRSPQGTEAFIWTETSGLITLANWLRARGAELGRWHLLTASAISADGSTAVGTGINPCGEEEAWRAVLIPARARCSADFNADNNVDPDDLGDFINCYFAQPACRSVDFNADCGIDPDDLGDYINAYFGGC